MPKLVDHIAIKDPFLDKRSKLLPCQKEMMIYWRRTKGESWNQIAKRFKVSKRTVQFIVDPEKREENVQRRRERGQAKYYHKEKHRIAMSKHRAHKDALFTEERVVVRGREDMAKYLRTMRSDSKLTLQKVAETLPDLLTDASHLSRIEWGEYAFQDLDKLSELLNFYGYHLEIKPNTYEKI